MNSWCRPQIMNASVRLDPDQSGCHGNTPCQLMSIDEDSFRQLLYRYPDFGLAVVRLIAGRMSNDVMRRAARGPRDGGDAPLAS